MKELAFKFLVDSINNNELNLYLSVDKKYLVGSFDERGIGFCIDYYAMANALNQYVLISPENEQHLRNGILACLRENPLPVLRSILEMTSFQLRYKNDLGFLNEEILKELKIQLNNYRNLFLEDIESKYKIQDEVAYKNSGKHFL